MKKKRRSQNGFSDLHLLLGFVLGSLGVLLVLVGLGISSGTSALAQGPKANQGRGATSQTLAASPVANIKIAPEVLADTAAGKSASVVIFLADQADVSAAYGMKDQDARGWFVYNTLTRHAARTQADLQAFLTTRGASYQSFWAANMIVTTADRSLVESLAARADVARIDSNRPARWIEKPEVANFEVTPGNPAVTTTVEWGVNNVNAPSVWALGFTGQGIVIGDQDTGQRWTHNALKPKYRGWNGTTADHNFNWHDSIHSGGGICGPDTMAPCDDSGHGTHTAGTTVGDDGAGNQVGVAPGAKWIGCRNMDVGNGMPSTYTECFQFMIAPTDLAGSNANPALRPHVLNNSWGCPVSEGCVTGAELETIVNNTQAAGIFVEVSAGNSGPSCSTVSDPPAIYSASFSTGAITISNALTSFSSRGPSTYYTPNLLKPNVSAPGSNVRSTYNSSDTTYANLSGTSMAGPHVVGVVALLWSARPQLARDIEATKTILQNTANPGVTVSAQTCGGTPSTQIPNNSFGYGRVDALAAVNSVPTACIRTVFSENFDTVTAPALPAGWTATNAIGPAPLWVTSTTTPDTAPNAAFVDDPAMQSDKRLDTPSIAITSTVAQVTFRHSFDFDRSGSSFFDGGVLEVSSPNIAAGAFTDITDATVGGSFIVGGYNATIGTSFQNPIGGRSVWGGNSGGYIITAANLGPHVAGQTIKLRFRMGSDTVAAGTGWHVDGISITDGPCPTLANISTRLLVDTGNNVLIGGFIVSGTQPKKVIVRAIGPSLPFADKLANPTLELRDGTGALIRSDDDWRTGGQEAEIIATTIPPSNDLESAIMATLPANNAAYTAIVRGANNGTGVGLVEVYDLDHTVDSKLGNISTRGLVQTGDNVIIAGTIVLGNDTQRVLVRAIGPSLTLAGKLADPTLELRDANGALIRSNDNWRTGGQEAEIIATGIPPTNDLESAIVAMLPSNGAAYTAILRGAGGTTGIAVVEVYALN
jgi:serine protease AprX